MECLKVNSIRNIIDLQWNLKVKDILPDLTSGKSDNRIEIPEKTISNIQCQIKGMDGLIFSLELTNQLNLVAKGHSSWSYRVVYAFAIVKDRAFLVKNNDRLNFLDLLKPNHLDSVVEVTFYCMILIGQPMVNPTFAETDLTNNKVLPTDGQMMGVDGEDAEQSQCKFDGEIPDFTDGNAKELISNERTNSVLKVLAMEYLIKNIKVENVSDILKIAVDQNLKALMKQCSEFLSECIIRRCKVSSSDLSDSSSDY